MTTPVSHLVCGYGAPKLGKTLDLGMTFCSGFFFAPALSPLTPLHGLAGFVPEKKAVVKDFRQVVAWLRQHKDDDKVASVVVDDLSLIGDHTLSALTKEVGATYDRWNSLNETFLEFFDLATNAPFFTCVTSHEIGPAEVKNTWIPGGPKMPSKPAGDNLGKNAGLILRAVVDSTSSAADSWPVIYSCDRADPNFTYGDRNGFALPQNPLNMREILKAGGVDLPRRFDWQEAMVEKIAGLVAEGKAQVETLQKAAEHMREKFKASPAAIWWTFRDAKARAYMRQHAADRLTALMDNMSLGVR